MGHASPFILVTLFFFLCSVVLLTSADPQFPFPQHVSLASGARIPSGSRDDLDSAVRTYYHDFWKPQYIVQVGNNEQNKPRYRVLTKKNDPNSHTVSEGQGYGMIIAAIMAEGDGVEERKILDGIWYFVRSHPSQGDDRLADWYVNADETDDGQGDNCATDGDLDMAYALLLAHRQWGSTGDINYLAEAQTVITAIRESLIGPESKLPTLGDWVSFDGADKNQYTPRISDFMYGHFKAFAEFDTSFDWNSVLSATMTVASQLQADYASNTGLLPDFAVRNSQKYKPADAGFLEGANDGKYYYNAGRIPWRIGTYAAETGNAEALLQTRRISNWIQTSTGGDANNIRPGYELNGNPIQTDYWSSFFASPMGVAAMTSDSQDAQAWLDAVYNSVKENHQDYYEDSVNLLSLIAMTGNFWNPATGGSGSDTGSAGDSSSSAGDSSSSAGDSSSSATRLTHWILY